MRKVGDIVRIVGDGSAMVLRIVAIDGDHAILDSLPRYSPAHGLRWPLAGLETEEEYQRRCPPEPPISLVEWRQRALDAGNV